MAQGEPGDRVGGPDPRAATTVRQELAYVGRCQFPGCEYLVAGLTIAEVQGHITQHASLAHPAVRNPELTCQEAPPWDHERWCVRPKGHDGEHWTPSFGGGRWWRAR